MVLSVSDGGKDIPVKSGGRGASHKSALPLWPPSVASVSGSGFGKVEGGELGAGSAPRKTPLAHGNFRDFFPLQRFPGNLGNS